MKSSGLYQCFTVVGPAEPAAEKRYWYIAFTRYTPIPGTVNVELKFMIVRILHLEFVLKVKQSHDF